jgi:hypothetical protein
LKDLGCTLIKLQEILLGFTNEAPMMRLQCGGFNDEASMMGLQ